MSGEAMERGEASGAGQPPPTKKAKPSEAGEKAESQQESSAGEMEEGWAENGPRKSTEREGPAELRDLVGDVFIHHLFPRLDLKSLCAVERTCHRFRRLAKTPVVYKGVDHVKVDDVDRAHNALRQLSLGPGFERKERSWEEALGHLLSRGAKIRIMEIKGPWSPLFSVQGLRTLVIDQRFIFSVPHLDLLALVKKMPSIECLIVDIDKPIHPVSFLARGAVQMVGGGPAQPLAPAIRVLIIQCPAKSSSFLDMTGQRQLLENSDLVCLKTPFPEHSFLKGPKDQPPHPDLLRLSRRYDWAH